MRPNAFILITRKKLRSSRTIVKVNIVELYRNFLLRYTFETQKCFNMLLASVEFQVSDRTSKRGKQVKLQYLIIEK